MSFNDVSVVIKYVVLTAVLTCCTATEPPAVLPKASVSTQALTDLALDTNPLDDPSCVSTDRPPVAVPHVISVQDIACAVPGAIPDDGLDDRAAISLALALQGCAYLPAGQYEIDAIPFIPPARRPYMMVSMNGSTVYGDGPATIVHFRGSAGGQDWNGFRMTGSAPTLRDLTLADDASGLDALSDTDEQTHSVSIWGPATNPMITRVTIRHPIRGDQKGGDCVQIVGYDDGRMVVGARIQDNLFETCDRSSVAVHSGVSDLKILRNVSLSTGNTDLDFEGSGSSSGIEIACNRFETSADSHGVGAMQLQLVTSTHVHNNVFNGRGIDLYQSDDVEFDHNNVTLTQLTSSPVIAIDKDSARDNFHHNTLVRAAVSGLGHLIAITPHGSGTPDHITIEDNELEQDTTMDVINASGVVGLYVRRNHAVYNGAPGVRFGVQSNGSAGTYAIRTDDIIVEANAWDGPLRGVVTVSGSYAGCGSVTTDDNVSNGAISGLMCSNVLTGAGVLGPISSARDSWPNVACGPTGFAAVTN